MKVNWGQQKHSDPTIRILGIIHGIHCIRPLPLTFTLIPSPQRHRKLSPVTRSRKGAALECLRSGRRRADAPKFGRQLSRTRTWAGFSSHRRGQAIRPTRREAGRERPLGQTDLGEHRGVRVDAGVRVRVCGVGECEVGRCEVVSGCGDADGDVGFRVLGGRIGEWRIVHGCGRKGSVDDIAVQGLLPMINRVTSNRFLGDCMKGRDVWHRTRNLRVQLPRDIGVLRSLERRDARSVQIHVVRLGRHPCRRLPRQGHGAGWLSRQVGGIGGLPAELGLLSAMCGRGVQWVNGIGNGVEGFDGHHLTRAKGAVVIWLLLTLIAAWALAIPRVGVGLLSKLLLLLLPEVCRGCVSQLTLDHGGRTGVISTVDRIAVSRRIVHENSRASEIVGTEVILVFVPLTPTTDAKKEDKYESS